MLLGDYRARKLAKAEGLEILGSVGLLETFYLRRYLIDLRSAFQQLLTHNVYITPLGKQGESGVWLEDALARGVLCRVRLFPFCSMIDGL